MCIHADAAPGMYYFPPGAPEHLHGGTLFYGPPGPPPPGVMIASPDPASLRLMLAKQIEYYFRLDFVMLFPGIYLSTLSITFEVTKNSMIASAV